MVDAGFLGFLGASSEQDDPNLKASMAQRFMPDNSDVRGAAWDEAIETGLTREQGAVNRVGYLESGRREEPLNMENSYFVQDFQPKKITEEEYKSSGYYNPNIEFYDGMTADSARFLSEREQRKNFNEMILSKATTGQRWQGIATGLAASFTDPWNVIGAFVPVPIVSAKLAASAEAAASFAGRTGYRAAQGAAEGAFGAAIMEPFVYSAANRLQEDYTFADSLKNLAIGSFIGSGLHAGTGLLGDALRYRGEKRADNLLRKAGKETDEAFKALDTLEESGRISVDDALEIHSLAVQQMAEGKQIDVEAITKLKLVQNAADHEPTPPFNIGEPTGEGKNARYQDYTKPPETDLPYLESVVEDVKSENPPEWVKEHNEAAKAKEEPAQGENAPEGATPSESINARAAGQLSPEKVAKVAEKLREGKPLGKNEAEVAKVIAREMEAKKGEATRFREERANDQGIIDERNGDVDDMIKRTTSNEAYAAADYQAADRFTETTREPYEYDTQLEADIAEYESRLDLLDDDRKTEIRDELAAIEAKASAEQEALKLANVCMSKHI